jgi:hypothetical protein
MPCRNLLNIFLGLGLLALYCAKKTIQTRISIGIIQMVFQRLALENGVFWENYNLYTERTTRRSKQMTMPCGNLPDIFLGYWQRTPSKPVQNRIRIWIRQMVFKRLARENGIFLRKFIQVLIQKLQIASPKSDKFTN